MGQIKTLILLTIISICHAYVVQDTPTVSYRGAVLEFEPYKEWETNDGSRIVQANADTISSYASFAKDYEVDIFVAPEYSLQSLDMSSHDIDRFLTVTQYIPDPDIGALPCQEDLSNHSNVQGIVTLSCTARSLEMYIVIDLAERRPCNNNTASTSPWTITTTADEQDPCPDHGYIFHNTQVVFDRTGAVVARYRKQNLYLEPIFSPGNEDDSTAIFTTDFGVTFSLQVCFDITYEHPGYSNIKDRGIRDVVMSTAWVDFLPYLIAPSVQNGWSSRLQANLLVSGYHWPERSKLGSGIYGAYAGENPDYTYDPNSGDVIVMSEITTVLSNATAVSRNNKKKKPLDKNVIKLSKTNKASNTRRLHLMFHDNLSEYSRLDLEKSTNGENRTETLCHNENEEFCCTLTYKSNSTLNYKFLVYSGMTEKGNGTYKIYAQICSVVWCRTNNLETCGLVETGVPGDDSFGPAVFIGNYECEEVYPLGLKRSLEVWEREQYNLMKLEGNTYMAHITKAVPDLLSLGMYGRWYARDPPH